MIRTAVGEEKSDGQGTAMTMLFSAATPQLIVMTADGVELREFEDHREYGSAKKYCCYEGVGCVTTWGARVGNNIERYLSGKRIFPGEHSVAELADLVMTFLVNEYRADEPVSDDIGYHVAGFDRSQKPRLYHILWGVPRPNLDQQPANYRLFDHSPSDERPIQLLYNGRNDIAQMVVDDLLGDLRSGKDMGLGFEVNTPTGLAQLGYFVARCAAELTPEVGPPYTTIIISPQNGIEVLTNSSCCPLDEGRVSSAVRRLEVSHLFQTSDTGHQIETPPQALPNPIEYTGGTITALPGFSSQPCDPTTGPD
jgi:hypothetical protein